VQPHHVPAIALPKLKFQTIFSVGKGISALFGGSETASIGAEKTNSLLRSTVL
jgi:hypothetical protein